jgi:hypothetical protein
MRILHVRKRLPWPVLLLILAVALAAAGGAGCKRMDKVNKNLESSFDGLNRTISLYDLNGQLVGRWNSKTDIEAKRTDIIAFLDSAGHEVKLAGGIVVVQEK